jgi:signal transduction histidine kinase
MTGNPARKSRRLSQLVVLAFILSVAAFVGSDLYSERVERGISEDALSIVENASPSIERLSSMRALLRHIEVTLDDYTDQAAATGKSNATQLANLERYRQMFDQEWTTYQQLPQYPGEARLWHGMTSGLRQLNSAIERIFARLHEGAGREAERILDHEVKPIIDRLVGLAGRLTDLNAANSSRLGRQIVRRRDVALRWRVGLGVLTSILTLVAGLSLARLLRSYSSLSEKRVVELELFSNRVAHDIRSPLQSVALAIDLTRSHGQLDPRSADLQERAARTVQRIGDLVDGLLVYARAGTTPSMSEATDASAVVNGVVRDLTELAAESKVELSATELAAGKVHTSTGVLLSIITNLVGNAIKHMGDSPVRKVMVRVRAVPERMRIEVQDTGPGISGELAPTIWQPFVRGAPPGVPGLGLGLATVQRLAEAHGGAVGLVQPEEGGCLFWVELPAVQTGKGGARAG